MIEGALIILAGLVVLAAARTRHRWRGTPIGFDPLDDVHGEIVTPPNGARS